MPTPTKKRELAGLWIALVVLATVAFLAYRSIDAAADTLGRVEHGSKVLHELEEVAATYARATAARRAYIVAGDESQLAEAHDLDAHWATALSVVRESVEDSPSQSARVDSLGRLMTRRLASLDAAVAQRRVQGAGVETAEGLLEGARVRAVREEFEAAESQLLVERDARTRRDLATTKLALVVGTLGSIAILLFAFRRLSEEVQRRYRSQLALRASEGFLDSIVENIPDMIFVKEAGELRFERINLAGEELLGVERKDLLRKNDFDFFPSDQAESFQARDRETLAGRVVVDIAEEPIQTKAGERWLHTKKVPVLDDKGIARYLLGISEDITERRLAKAALKAAKDAAEAANQELESFSYSVAHDLRAPLRAIDGFSRALEEDCGDKLDAEGKLHLQRVRSSTQQMSQLIDGLLGLSRLTREDITRQKVDLTRLAEECAARLREAHPAQSVELVVQPNMDAQGDPRLLTAALDNLLGNSWKFTGKCKSPRVEVGRKEDGAFFVRDNGAGFDQAYAHKLFGAFQRLHGAAEFDGSGIGLATVQRIVRRHGGRVWAEGEVGRGATFYFTL
jgi:PAS domain S-box-containing protein